MVGAGVDVDVSLVSLPVEFPVVEFTVVEFTVGIVSVSVVVSSAATRSCHATLENNKRAISVPGGGALQPDQRAIGKEGRCGA